MNHLPSVFSPRYNPYMGIGSPSIRYSYNMAGQPNTLPEDNVSIP